MPLIPCPDCGTEVSDQAKACPKCGRPATPVRPTQPITYTPTAVVITIVVALLAMYVTFTPAKWEEARLFLAYCKRMLGLG